MNILSTGGFDTHGKGAQESPLDFFRSQERSPTRGAQVLLPSPSPSQAASTMTASSYPKLDLLFKLWETSGMPLPGIRRGKG